MLALPGRPDLPARPDLRVPPARKVRRDRPAHQRRRPPKARFALSEAVARGQLAGPNAIKTR
jgi:hypothetical protein